MRERLLSWRSGSHSSPESNRQHPLNAEILSIGTELLLGEIVDGNAAYLAGELADLGIPVYWISQVGDNQSRLEEALQRALSRSTIVITTGGLGPTDDDLTREAIAAVVGERPTVAPMLEEDLRSRFKAMGREMPEKNIKQAWLIPSAETLPNPLGTAPGWWVTTNERHIASMPGVPLEMRRMWSDEVRPRLAPLGQTGFASVTVKTFGLGESAVEQQLGDLVNGSNPSVATYAKRDGVQVRVAASAASEDLARAALDPVLALVRARLGEVVYGSDGDSPASVAGSMLRAREATVATMESVTGGLVASYLTDVPGSSGYVCGGAFTYTEEIKKKFGIHTEILERHGVVSAEVAVALANAARYTFGSTWGIGTTGAAGPDAHGGAEPGTAYVAVTAEGRRNFLEVRRIAPRETVKHFVALSAIDLLRRTLPHPRTRSTD